MTDNNMNDVVAPDPWDIADNPPVNYGEYWGQVEIDLWYCVLQKGAGRIPFDAQVHPIDQRRTAIDIMVFPLPEHEVSYDVSRKLIAESKDWAGIVLKSIKALVSTTRDLNKKWVMVKQVPTGRSYTNNNGEVREQTTFEFIKVFDSEDQCRADYLASANGSSRNAVSMVGDGVVSAKSGTSSSAKGDNDRQTAFNFLKIYVQNACHKFSDIDQIRGELSKSIAEQPLLAKYFTVDSPETVQLILEGMTK